MNRKNEIVSVDSMIFNTKGFEYFIKNLLALINEFSKITSYKINIQKDSPFKRLPKHLPNLAKDMNDFYTEESKTVMKEVKMDINKWQDTSWSWIHRTDVKMSLLLKAIYSFNLISVTI